MSEVFKLDALDLVDRAEARMQVTDSVAGAVCGYVGVGWGEGNWLGVGVCDASRSCFEPVPYMSKVWNLPASHWLAGSFTP
jgi:hypothetical protein